MLPLENPLENSPLRKGGVKRFFNSFEGGVLAVGVSFTLLIPLGAKLLHTVFFCFGEFFSVVITGNFTAYNSWANQLL